MTRGILFSLLAFSAFGQSAPKPPSFEVAAIKLNTSGGPGPQKERFLPGGRLEIGNATLKELIPPLYGVKPDMVIGGPKWLDSDRFDIVAKASQDTPVPTLLLMAKTLLEERFKLVYHREDKLMPAYALVVAKGGMKLRQSAGGGRQSCGSRPVNANGVPVIHRECQNVTMAEFVRQLGLGGYGLDDRPVVNLTQLTGPYDFEFEFSRPRSGGQGDAGRPGEAPVSADLAGPTIFDAVAQLGLKLEASRQTVPVMVIDSAEHPVE